MSIQTLLCCLPCLLCRLQRSNPVLCTAFISTSKSTETQYITEARNAVEKMQQGNIAGFQSTHANYQILFQFHSMTMPFFFSEIYGFCYTVCSPFFPYTFSSYIQAVAHSNMALAHCKILTVWWAVAQQLNRQLHCVALTSTWGKWKVWMVADSKVKWNVNFICFLHLRKWNPYFCYMCEKDE